MEAKVNIGRRMELDALGLVKWPIMPRPHSLKEDVPGRVFLDAWGWMGTTWYQRKGRADLAYFKRDLIAESFIRGSNYLQLHPALDRIHWNHLDKLQLLELLRDIHAHDMVVDEHCFPPKPKTAEAELAWFRDTWGKLSANLKEHGWMESVDGFEGEAFNDVFEHTDRLMEMTDLLWRLNPGLWASHASFPCGPEWLSKEKHRPPCYLKSPVCLNFLGFKLGAPEGRAGFLGYDDKNPVIRPFPGCGGLHPSSGKIYLGYQADCRIKGTEIIRKPSRWIGGGSTPDWVLKQLDDFFRHRGLWPDDPHETAIWWLGEPPENLPLEYRDYVYAISQDPLKHAIAADLAHGGVGGFLDQRKAKLLKQAQDEGVDTSAAQWWKMRPRSKFPHTTRFIQNAYLRLYLKPDQDGGTLQYDWERVAHFDSDSLSLPLTERLIETQVIKEPLSGSSPNALVDTGSFAQTFNVEKRGGHLAVLKSQTKLLLSSSKILEEQCYQTVNDAPYLILNINRKLYGTNRAIMLTLGCEGYNHLVADGKHYDKVTTFQQEMLPKVWQLRDTSGFKPDLVVLLLAKGQTSSIEWTPAQSLRLIGPANDQLQIAWVVPTDLYDSNDFVQLASALKSMIHPVSLSKDGSMVRNDTGVPYNAVVRIENPGKGPYMVQEKDWWSVRGAQRSLLGTDQNDYLKVYLPAGSTSRILSYGFIDGIAKPGYGCQYTMALRDLTGNNQEASCTAKVLSVTPFLFAPRVKFAQPIGSVELNGQAWHYFEGQLVFLPNETGTYKLRVHYGNPGHPTLTRTFAHVKKTEWDGKTLQLEVQDPPWAGSVSPDLYYYATVNTLNSTLKTAEDATVAEDRGPQWLIRFRPGIVRLIAKK
ncbi:MAG: hypothetical protein JSV03_13655 [Planctomycetota bacterium]|nr:MAG: hypothetical protein JSV03_13655 [Planctomycetota bacterium]